MQLLVGQGGLALRSELNWNMNICIYKYVNTCLFKHYMHLTVEMDNMSTNNTIWA